MRYEYLIFIDDVLYDTKYSAFDAMLVLGAKYGGNTYNKMIDEKKIIFKETEHKTLIYVTTK